MGFDEQSRYWAHKAIRSKAFTVTDAAKETKLTVLALFTQASGSLNVNRRTFGISTTEGHNNLVGLLDSDHISLVRFQVDTLDQQPELLRKLPTADVIYNSITDPERCEHALHLAQKVCDRLDLPVINDPKAVLDASREGNYQRFQDHSDIIVPKSVKIESVQGEAKPFVKQAMQEHGFSYPVLVRVSGYQNGKYMQRVEDLESHDLSEIDALTTKGPETLYVIQYHESGHWDERAPDKPLYPKYRAFLINGELYPAHVRFGYGDWNVHMPEHKPTIKRFPWLYEWEERFFADPAASLPDGMWDTLREAMQTVGLDYLGIDFAVVTEPENADKLIVFEANAAMRNFLDQLEQGIPAHRASAEAITAAHSLLVERGVSEPWGYHLPPGRPNPANDIVASTQASDARVVQEWRIDGELQGSGFREWFWHRLHMHGLEGWLRYIGDTQLQAVVEGHPERINHLLSESKEKAPGKVEAIETQDWIGERPQGVHVLEREDHAIAEVGA
jgi:acylphosphatase/glutathione synthase/RimK-type ligase-like ATP-grasp enzyme